MSRWVARVRVRSRARSPHVSFEVVAILRHGCVVGAGMLAFRGTGVRSKVSPLVGAGLPGPISGP